MAQVRALVLGANLGHSSLRAGKNSPSNGHQTTYTYDYQNRMATKQYADYTSVTYTYDAAGRLTQVSDPTGTYTFGFDNMGRLTSATTNYKFSTFGNKTVQYGYDPASNRVSITDPQNVPTTYGYDNLNRLTSLIFNNQTLGFTFGYDDLSRGKLGTDGTFPVFYATEVKLSWLESGGDFFGRPPLAGASRRNVECSSEATNSGLPSGHPLGGNVPSAPCCPADRKNSQRRAPSIGAQMMRRNAVLLCFASLMFTLSIDVQSSSTCPDRKYENHNQVDYGPMVLPRIVGAAIDQSGAPVPNACVLLFTDANHKLLSKLETDGNGQFKLPKIKRGRYRLVVKAYGFCSANVPIVITAAAPGKELAVHMKMGAVDSCSYGDIK